MADDIKYDDGNPIFKVTPEDCQRWAQRFHKMAKVLEKKDGDNADGVKMFYTAAALMSDLCQDIQQSMLFGAVPTILDPVKPGEA